MRRAALLSAIAAVCALSFLGGCKTVPQEPVETSFDGVATGENLEIRLFAVNDLYAFREKWNNSDRVPDEQSEDLVLLGGTVHLPILFKGCGAEEGGSCELYGRLSIYNDDSGELVYRGKKLKLWSNEQAAEPGIWSMATHVPNVTVRESGAPMRILFEVTDETWNETTHAGLLIRTKENGNSSAK